MRSVINFFDKLEDHVRAALSHYPLFYSFIGGTGVILFWRGIWHSADYLEENTYLGSFIFSNFGSMVLGVVILLMTGLFVSIFIGDSIIMSGIKKDKKLIEKSETEIDSEIRKEKKVMNMIQKDIQKIDRKLKIKPISTSELK